MPKNFCLITEKPSELDVKIGAALSALPCAASNEERARKFAMQEIKEAIYRVRMLPALTPAPPKQRRAELSKLAALAADLSHHLKQMHGSSLFPVEREFPSVGNEFVANLDALNSIADRAAAEVPAQKVSGGRPVKMAGRGLAASLCAVFESYTGRRATITNDNNRKTGQFVQFVKAILDAAEIKEHAANLADEVVTIRRNVFSTPAIRDKG